MSVLICQLSMVFKGSECKRERYLHTKYVCVNIVPFKLTQEVMVFKSLCKSCQTLYRDFL